MELLKSIEWAHFFEAFRDLIEILLLFGLIYLVLLFLRGTRAAMVLLGIAITTIVLLLVSSWLGLHVIAWLLAQAVGILAIAVVVIFHPEIRRAFAEAGSNKVISKLHTPSKQGREVAEILVNTALHMSNLRIGALIAIERHIGFRAIADTGTMIMGQISRELITSIFFPNTPLHDGGVIIKDGTLVAAGCIFPLSQNPDFNKSLGMRHRAALGISEETDALVLVVSEESGGISLAYKGRLVRNMSKERLRRHLMQALARETGGGTLDEPDLMEGSGVAPQPAEDVPKA